MNLGKAIGLMVAVSVAALAFAGCDAITGSDSSSSKKGAKILDGIWIGWADGVTDLTTDGSLDGTGNEVSARIDGFDIDGGEIVRFIESGAWVTVADVSTEIDAIPIDTTSSDNVFTIDGSIVGDDNQTNVIVINAAETHMGFFSLAPDPTIDDYIDIMALAKQDTDTIPAAPTSEVDAGTLAGTYTGISFDVTTASPPAINSIVDDTITFTSPGSTQLMVDSGSTGTIMGMDLAAEMTPLQTDSPYDDAFFGYFWNQMSGSYDYPMFAITSPDSGALAVAVCFVALGFGGATCGDGNGASFSLANAADSGGWGFSLLIPQ